VGVSSAPAPRPKRLDQRVAPGWADLCTNLLRGGGVLGGLLLLWLGFLTGGFFLLLTGALALIALVGGWLLGGLIQRESWYGRPNSKVTSLALVLLFPVALVAFAQVVGPLLTPPPVKSACFAGSPSRDGELHTELAVDPRIKTMVFNFQVTEISDGAVRWFVQDPTGQSRWSGREESPGTFSSAELQSVGGQWTLNVISEADQLSYNLEWRSLDPAAEDNDSSCLTPPG
jgi:hypothetical protein